MITSNRRVTGLWKSVENAENAARACSGCAGDYEDPDRSAWEEGFEEEDGEFCGRRAMSQDLTSEGVDRTPDVAASDGMYQPGRTQRETLLMVLRQAAEYEQWKTLAELAIVTRFPPASISAQLRHLRKAEYGGWGIEKRRREWVRDELVWEYRLAEGGKKGGKGGRGSKGGKGERGGGDEREAGDGV